MSQARKASNVQGLATRSREGQTEGREGEVLRGSVVKVRSDSVDVRFDSDGTVQKKLTGVIHDECATPVNQRFEAWRPGRGVRSHRGVAE